MRSTYSRAVFVISNVGRRTSVVVVIIILPFAKSKINLNHIIALQVFSFWILTPYVCTPSPFSRRHTPTRTIARERPSRPNIKGRYHYVVVKQEGKATGFSRD